MEKIVILGAGGHAHVIADIVEAEGNTFVGFLDDDPSQKDAIGKIDDYKKYKDCKFIIGIGSADVREKLSKLDVSWGKAIHPSAIVSKSVSIGEGSVVMPKVVINARTVIGKHCIINTGAIVEHDNKIGDYAHVSVGAKLGGTVTLGKKAWVGIGASIINNVSICDKAFIGAGATVVNDIKEEGTYVGVPARKLVK